MGLSLHSPLSRGSQNFDLFEVVSIAMLGIPVGAFGHVGVLFHPFLPESEEMTRFLGTSNKMKPQYST